MFGSNSLNFCIKLLTKAIPAALQAHLFDKFSAAARKGLAGESTTGLGLFITQQIVRLHGGQVWVESQENEGTTFFIDLQAASRFLSGLRTGGQCLFTTRQGRQNGEHRNW